MTKTPNATRQPNYPDQIISDKPQSGAEHAVNATPISADLRRMAGAGAKSAPITLMTEDRACKWAWDQVREDVGTDGWTAGESCTFYGFFLWGWNYRGQYETQRRAAPTAPAGGAVPDERQAFEHYQCDRMRRDLQELTMHPDGRYDCDDIQAEWEVWQARAALAAAPAQAVAVPADALESVRILLRVAKNQSNKAGMAHAIGVVQAEVEKAAARITATPAQEHATQLAGQEPFQLRVRPWMMVCFGAEIAGDKQERNHRFLEEAVELVQANGCTVSEAHQLVDYVYGRPVGELPQEVGGVMVTLAALCLASGVDMHQAGEVELQRIWGKVEQIRAKQAAKPKHSALPAAPAQAQEDAGAQHDSDSKELRRLCQDRDRARRECDKAKAEIAGLEASCSTLGRLVDELRAKADRYDYLRERDLEAVHQGGVFAGKTPDNLVLNGDDLDVAIDAARAAQGGA